MERDTLEGQWMPPTNDYRDLDLAALETIEDCDEASSWLGERAIALHDQITMVVDDDEVRVLKSHLARLHNLRNEVRILKSQYWREDVDVRQARHRDAITRKTAQLKKLMEDPEAQRVIDAKRDANIAVQRAYLDGLNDLAEKKAALKQARIERSNADRVPFLQQLILTLRDELGREETQRICERARTTLEERNTGGDE